MAEFYAHERLAKAAAQSMTMDPMVYENFSAYLVGSNGPDPMFFRVLWRFEGGGMGVQKLGARLHDERDARVPAGAHRREQRAAQHPQQPGKAQDQQNA